MKYVCLYFFLVSLPCLFSSNAKCQTQENSDSIVRRIRAEYLDVNKKKLRIEEKNLEGYSSEGGLLKKFYDGNRMKKAVLVFYGETGKSINEFYFDHDSLFFVYRVEERYDKPIYDTITKKTVLSDRFYFVGNRIFLWVRGEKKINDRKACESKEKEIKEDLKTFLKL